MRILPDATTLIVGAGEAGVAAAGALRDHGYGGRILLVGAEQDHPYARPPLSKAMLTQAACPVEPIRDLAWLHGRGIELRLGTCVQAIDVSSRQAILSNGVALETVGWDRLLLATGARPRRLSMLAPLGERVAYLRTYQDGLALRHRLARSKSVAIVGGGVIGLEVASSARRLGCEVVVIEPADRLMSRAVAPGASALLLDLHRRNGVDVRLRTGLLAAEAHGDQVRLALSGGLSLISDTVIAAIGVEPDDALARTLGCAVDDGIVVDGHCRTSVANVFAAGDVARFANPLFDVPLRVEAWQHARKHGAHAARAMMGEIAPYAEIPWFWTDQHGVNIQVAGIPGEADVHVNRGATTLHMKGDRLVAATTVDNGREMRPCINLIARGWRGPAAMLLDGSRPLSGLAREHELAMAL